MVKVLTAADILSSYEKITSIKPFFKVENNVTVFTGKSLELHIPKRLEIRNLLHVGDTITTLGYMHMIIDEKYRTGLRLFASIEMDNGELDEIVVDNQTYLRVRLSPGSRFMTTNTLIRNGAVVYAVFAEQFEYGRVGYWVEYDTMASLFDQAGPIADGSINVDHSLLEVICSHIARVPGDKSALYRYADTNEQPEWIGLRSIGHGTSSTTNRIIGSYFNLGLTAALANPSTVNQPLEDILRQ